MRALTEKITGIKNVHGIWLAVCLLNLLLAAGLGVLLRYVFVDPIEGVKYRNVLHGHSHTALLGWIHAGIYVFFHRFFVPARHQNKPGYHYIFWLSQLLVLGCFIFFPLYGYNALTIAFTSVHVVLTYWFAVLFFRDSRSDPRPSVKWARIALLWIILATTSVWALAPISSTLGKADLSYLTAIQFYLHFQFNGFHVFAFFALLVWHMEQTGIAERLFYNPVFVLLLILSVFLMFGYNLYWIYGADELYALFAPGAALEVTLFIAAGYALRKHFVAMTAEMPAAFKLAFYVALLSLMVKSMLQAGLMLPFVADMVINLRHLYVAFLHMSFLGTMTFMFIFYANRSRIWMWSDEIFIKIGIYLFLIGYIATECILMLQGLMFWNSAGFMPAFYEGLVVAGGLLFIGILFWSVSVLRYESIEIPAENRPV